MQQASRDESVALLRALFGLAADHVIDWEVRREAAAAGCVGRLVVRVVSPSSDEVCVELHDSASGGRSWISEGGLDLTYQGPEMRSDGQGPRERLLAAIGASFRATMAERGPELRVQLAWCLERARACANGRQWPRGDEGKGRSTEAVPSGRVGDDRAQVPTVLLMALEDFDRYDGSAVSEDGLAAVDVFLSGLVEAQTIAAAFEIGLVDTLLAGDSLSFEELCERLDITVRGLRLLTGLLVGSGVLDLQEERFTVSAAFQRALQHRGLLLTLLGLIALAAQDLTENAPAFFHDPWEFSPRAHRLGLFNYRETDPKRARVWVAVLSLLTRYEAPACIRRYDMNRYRRVLDVGGNSGEFARQICTRHAHIEATVFDLPVVCEVGTKYLAGKRGAERVSFVGGDMTKDPLPRDFDLVCFKSVLNDWESGDVRVFLRKALDALRPGGRVLIYEREAIDLCHGRFPFRQLAVLPYLSNLRSAAEYSALLDDLGFTEIEAERSDPELGFLLVTACRRTDRAAR